MTGYLFFLVALPFHYVLNISYYIFQTSLSCCAPWGTTLDTQTVHSKVAYVYKMFNMTKSRSYIATDFASVFESENQTERNVRTKFIPLTYIFNLVHQIQDKKAEKRLWN